ncbi:MAG: hypothetical protein AAF802_27265 [Planctomycetota bacterium]
MDQSVRDVLTAADRLGEWESPADGYDYDSLWSEIDALVPQVETLVGYSLDVDRNVQDASFLTDVGLLSNRFYDDQSSVIDYVFSIRFSNFSRLFTIHGKEWQERYDELRLGECIELFTEHKFKYIPSDVLHVPYDGVNGADHPIADSPLTWWIRFFDYL